LLEYLDELSCERGHARRLPGFRGRKLGFSRWSWQASRRCKRIGGRRS
jgi:hypothetical protein